jgi:DNA repair exonuclease SbcCD ATPase subunit
LQRTRDDALGEAAAFSKANAELRHQIIDLRVALDRTKALLQASEKSGSLSEELQGVLTDSIVAEAQGRLRQVHAELDRERVRSRQLEQALGSKAQECASLAAAHSNLSSEAGSLRVALVAAQHDSAGLQQRVHAVEKGHEERCQRLSDNLQRVVARLSARTGASGVAGTAAALGRAGGGLALPPLSVFELFAAAAATSRSAKGAGIEAGPVGGTGSPQRLEPEVAAAMLETWSEAVPAALEGARAAIAAVDAASAERLRGMVRALEQLHSRLGRAEDRLRAAADALRLQHGTNATLQQQLADAGRQMVAAVKEAGALRAQLQDAQLRGEHSVRKEACRGCALPLPAARVFPAIATFVSCPRAIACPPAPLLLSCGVASVPCLQVLTWSKSWGLPLRRAKPCRHAWHRRSLRWQRCELRLRHLRRASAS